MKFDISRFDIYGKPIEVNLNGETHVKTNLGAFLTIVTGITMLVYTYDRTDALLVNKSININYFDQQNYYNHSYEFDLDVNEFRFGFAVQAADGLPLNKNDSDYVTWKLAVSVGGGSMATNYPLTYHVCTPEDYKSFFPPQHSIETFLSEQMQQQAMYCVDDFTAIL